MASLNPFSRRDPSTAPEAGPLVDVDGPGSSAPASPAGYRNLDAQLAPRKQKQLEKLLRRALDTAVTNQTGAATAYVKRLRATNPTASPETILGQLDRHFLTIVGAAGTAAGASAVIPGIGTVAALGAVSADALAFLEAVTFHTIAKAIVYGIDIHSVQQREILVSIVVLGASGNTIVARATKGRKGASLAKQATQLPDVATINNLLVTRLARKFVMSRLKGSLTKFLPAGIGAVLGGWGNVKAGRVLLRQSHEAFGAPPREWPVTPELTTAGK